jgi:hypothetical protein
MMNKKILVSIAAAAAIATTFTGCGSSDSSTSAAATTGTTTTGTSGYATLADGTVVGLSKGALSGASVAKSGTSVTGSGGTDVVSNTAFTGTVKTDTELKDSEGRVIANPFTTLAVNSGESNVTTALGTIATQLGFTNGAAITKVFQATAEDATAENTARLLQKQIEKATETSLNMGVIFRTVENATAGLSNALAALNNITGAESNTTQLTAMINNITLNPTAFANTLAQLETNSSIDFNSTVQANAAALKYTGFILDTNASDTLDINSTNGLASISPVKDSNLSLTSYNDLNETAELLISIRNTATTGANANASYALRMTKLSPVSGVSNYLTSFASSANSSLVVTANSNMSKGLTLTDGNITKVLLGLTAGTSTTDGMDFNLTGLTTYLTTLVGTGHDTTTNGNFTSGMSAAGIFGAKILVKIGDYNLTDANQTFLIGKDSVNIGKDVGTAAVGTQYTGFKVLDGNLTK